LKNSSKNPQIVLRGDSNQPGDYVYEFEFFRLDSRERLLLRDGKPIPLTPKVFDTLLLLVQNSGHLVLKDDLMLTLWPDRFVGEANLSQNISVVRKALGDTAQNPRYIVTVSGRGYRFDGEVRKISATGHNAADLLIIPRSPVTQEDKENRVEGEQVRRGYRLIGNPVTSGSSGDEVGAEPAAAPVDQRMQPIEGGLGHSFATPWELDARRGHGFLEPEISLPTPPATQRIGWLPFHFTRWQSFIAAGIVLTLVVGAASWWFLPGWTPRVVRSTRLSFSGRVAAPFPVFGEWFPAVLTDGSRIYFSTSREATLRLAYLSVAGGDQVPMTVPLDEAEPRHISPDGSLLLVYGSLSGEADKHLWLVPTAGRGPRRLGSIDGHDGAWSSDGRRFLYAQGHDLFVAEQDGSNSRKLVTTPGKAFWLRWSPNGSLIRFTLVDPTSNAQTLWECRADGSNLHRLPISWDKQPQECCGEWAVDGKYFFFRTFLDARADLWSIAEPSFLSRSHKPIRLTSGPLEFASAVPSRGGRQLLTVGVEPKWEVLSYNLETQHARVWIPERSAFGPSTSRDGRWIAYVEVHGKESILWRSRPDGSDRLQLSEPPLFVHGARWSPDGKQIAFMGKTPDKPWNIYVVPTVGGVPRALLNDGRNAVDPEWSADGHLLMYGRPPESWAEAGAPKAIYMLNLTSKEISKLPGSDGLYSPRWSPDGRYVVAMPLDEKKLVLFDFTTQQWKDLAAFPHIGSPQWSPDSNYIYIDGFDNLVVRVRRIDGKLERIVDLKTIDPNALVCYFANLTPDGELLLACPLARGDIYALDLKP
jgi:DNA-binding winged helix-turn-helix (wHTH) protein/Tol biopolymer transport system component